MTDQLSAPLDEFKPRELEILAMMAEGHSNREIAEQLFITKETVRWYNKQIYSKLGTSRRTEAIALAQKFG
ncbi:MAG: helix-turn-helix transcriptional regulator, partial [Chloroflexota bacterium]